MNNKVRAALVSIISICGILSSAAQTPDETKAMIDDIKMNETFIYGEDSDNDDNSAYENALSDLTLSANEIRIENGQSEVTMAEIGPFVKKLRYIKGQRRVTFLYAEVEAILALSNKTRNDATVQDIISDGNGAADSSVSQDSAPSGAAISTVSAMEAARLSDDIIQTLCNQDNWSEIKGFLSYYKQMGKIKETGLCLNPSEVPDDAYSILIDEMYGILSILSPKNIPGRINYRTNQPDSESNYSNCKVIVWYK